MDPIAFRGIERIIIAFGSILLSLLGYFLFAKGIDRGFGKLEADFTFGKIIFSGSGPGLFFMAWGSLIMLAAIMHGGAVIEDPSVQGGLKKTLAQIGILVAIPLLITTVIVAITVLLSHKLKSRYRDLLRIYEDAVATSATFDSEEAKADEARFRMLIAKLKSELGSSHEGKKVDSYKHKETPSNKTKVALVQAKLFAKAIAKFTEAELANVEAGLAEDVLKLEQLEKIIVFLKANPDIATQLERLNIKTDELLKTKPDIAESPPEQLPP